MLNRGWANSLLKFSAMVVEHQKAPAASQLISVHAAWNAYFNSFVSTAVEGQSLKARISLMCGVRISLAEPDMGGVELLSGVTLNILDEQVCNIGLPGIHGYIAMSTILWLVAFAKVITPTIWRETSNCIHQVLEGKLLPHSLWSEVDPADSDSWSKKQDSIFGHATIFRCF